MGAAGGDPLGTCAVAITAGPQSESIDGAWTMEGDAISAVLTVESEEVTWNLTYEGDQLTMDQNGQFETFRREEDEAYAPRRAGHRRGSGLRGQMDRR